MNFLHFYNYHVAAGPGPLACPSRGARPLAAALGTEIVLT